MECIKKLGTREEVYKNIASRTAGGLCKTDIIEREYKGKLIYISKKISDKMKLQMTTSNDAIQTQTQAQPPTQAQQIIKQSKQQKSIMKKNKKTLALSSNLLNKHKSKTHKISFQINKNEVKNVYYPELKGVDLQELKEELLREEAEEDNCIDNSEDNQKTNKLQEPFKIEELPDIDINELS
jgi:hypothetical protein